MTIRFALYPAPGGDMELFLLPWLGFIETHGGYKALAFPFSNYAPFYTYLLVAAAWAQDWAPALLRIKVLTLPFELAAAIIAAKLVRLTARDASPLLPLGTYVAVLFAPTVVLNSSAWGQCDIIYASGLLLSLYWFCRDRPLAAMLAFGFAFAAKAQAVFFAPFLLMLLLRRRMSWGYVLLVPAVYVVLALPAVILGRPLLDILLVYAAQAGEYRRLSSNAANLWLFANPLVPDRLFEPAVAVGLAVSAVIALAFAVAGARRKASDASWLVLAATASTALMPLVLPKMHERYFFAAELLAIPLAFVRPTLFVVPVLLQATGVLAYLPFLFDPDLVHFQPLDRRILLGVAAVINMGIVALLVAHATRMSRRGADRAVKVDHHADDAATRDFRALSLLRASPPPR